MLSLPGAKRESRSCPWGSVKRLKISFGGQSALSQTFICEESWVVKLKGQRRFEALKDMVIVVTMIIWLTLAKGGGLSPHCSLTLELEVLAEGSLGLRMRLASFP